ncbi:MAG: hypothetical protein LDL13_01285 [Calditerrivibrio sp.]|nr:hypothetical protein [Calditerrivibrio sp.]MCA1932195.1 hypothetical protein [Calditerrivibrio sp.]
MKLKCTNKKFAFINPSVNMLKISLYLEDYGNSVKRYITENSIILSGNRIVYRKDEDNIVISFDISNKFLPDQMLRFKDSFFSRYLQKRFFKEFVLSSSYEYLLRENFPMAERYLFSNCETINGIRGVIEDNKDTIFIASYLDLRDFSGIEFNKEIAVFSPQFNVEKYIGRDYIFIYDKELRIEIFINNNHIYLMSDRYEHIEATINRTFLKNVLVEPMERFKILRNEDISCKKIYRNLFLLNDYSFFNLSLNPGKIWYERVGEYLCSGKL